MNRQKLKDIGLSDEQIDIIYDNFDPKIKIEATDVIGKIVDVVCDYFQQNYENVLSRDRSWDYRYPRQIIQYLCRRHTSLSSDRIGKRFGFSHCTILSSCNKIKDLMEYDKGIAKDLQEIENQLKSII